MENVKIALAVVYFVLSVVVLAVPTYYIVKAARSKGK